ncbi:hypothetical protein [Sunxiuqinia elliptica]|nr:hypothetical protein [Sunxiuqinia elliptica]
MPDERANQPEDEAKCPDDLSDSPEDDGQAPDELANVLNELGDKLE